MLTFIGYIFGVLFSFWPLMVLAPLGWRRGNVLRGMLVAWIFLFIGWIFMRFIPPIPSWFIPEPTNTYLFFLAGLALIGWTYFEKSRDKKFIYKTAAGALTTQELIELTPPQFEKMVVELYNIHGYTAQRTGAIGDHGVDVFVRTPKGEKWIIQCKRWRGAVGEPVIRDFYGTILHEKADRGVLITTGIFTNQACAWAKGKPMSLVNGTEFLATWKKEKRQQG